MSRRDTPRPDIELHIEELVLEGFAPHERQRVAAALEQHLAQLLARQFSEGSGAPALFARDAHIARLDGGSFDAAPAARAEALGAQAAQAVYGALAKSTAPRRAAGGGENIV